MVSGFLVRIIRCSKAIKIQHQITKNEKFVLSFCFNWRLVYFCIHLINGKSNANMQN